MTIKRWIMSVVLRPTMHGKSCVVLLLLTSLVGLIVNLRVNQVRPGQHVNQDTMRVQKQMDGKAKIALDAPVEVKSSHLLERDTLRILFWTPWFFQRWWFLPETSVVTCGDVTCQFTHDKSLYGVSHAVLFHLFHRSFHPDEIHVDECMPDHRDPSQYWIVHNVDPPTISIRENITQLNNLFNLSSTFHSRSDLVTPYGRCEVNARSSPGELIRDTYTTGKTGIVGWIVSHCNTHSGRENYVQQLQQHINVTVYGKCPELGSKGMVCSERLFINEKDCPEATDLINSFKFYIAFENSVCTDYITEKVYKILVPGMKTVPIVYDKGSGYKDVLPPHSYIDAASFASPEDLAVYLHKLDQDDALYNEYFQWRKEYTCSLKSVPCAFCQQFHEAYGRKNTVVADVPALFGPKKNCKASVDTYIDPTKTMFIGCKARKT